MGQSDEEQADDRAWTGALPSGGAAKSHSIMRTDGRETIVVCPVTDGAVSTVARIRLSTLNPLNNLSHRH